MEPKELASLLANGVITESTAINTTSGIINNTSGTITFTNSDPVSLVNIAQSPQFDAYLRYGAATPGFFQIKEEFQELPVAKVYPKDKHSVFKKNGVYIIKPDTPGYLDTHISLKSVIRPDGVLPEELLAVTKDYLESFEASSEYEQQAIKHINYAIAFLAKHILETNNKR